jgi:hypothetical protein
VRRSRTTTSVGAFFVSGHDKRAESAVVKSVYDSVPALLVEHGGPGGKNAAEELRRYQATAGEYLQDCPATCLIPRSRWVRPERIVAGL